MVEAERRPIDSVRTVMPVVAVVGALVLLVAVAWTQFLSPVGSYRKTIEVPIPTELTEKLWGSKATLVITAEDGSTGKVRHWAVSNQDQLRLLGFSGRRRNVTYTTLNVSWPDGRTETAQVEIRL